MKDSLIYSYLILSSFFFFFLETFKKIKIRETAKFNRVHPYYWKLLLSALQSKLIFVTARNNEAFDLCWGTELYPILFLKVKDLQSVGLELMWLIHSRNVGVKECECKAKNAIVSRWKWNNKKEATNWTIYCKMLSVKCIKPSTLH